MNLLEKLKTTSKYINNNKIKSYSHFDYFFKKYFLVKVLTGFVKNVCHSIK